MFIHHHQNREEEKGQVLLITVMLLAAAVTVVMTIAFNSTTETQITKMEEDSQRALSAAESALETVVQQKTLGVPVAIGSLPAFAGSGITGQATAVEMAGNEFVTPLLQRDEEYTFYLSDYQTMSSFWSGDLVVYLKSETPANCPVLELTFIDSVNNMTKGLVDPCNMIQGGATNRINTTAGGPVKDTQFGFKTTPVGTMLAGLNSKKFVIVRVLNAATRIGFTGTSMKSQGRVVTSEATTQTGVTKKIELFQSYPQIPADFFVTSF